MHCAADGLKYPPLVPVWRPEAITLQPIRGGFPCFGAAIIGYVEATRSDDAEKNGLCSPSPLPDSMATWAKMNILGTRAVQSFSAEPDIKEWANRVALDPAGSHPAIPDPQPWTTRSSAWRSTRRGLAHLAMLAE